MAKTATAKKTVRKKAAVKTTKNAADKGHAGISSAAVAAATGKTWDEWIGILDRAGGRSLSHKECAEWLAKAHDVRPWWQQMVVVGYEHAIGRRVAHETTKGFQVSASRVIGVPVAAAYRAFAEKPRIARWLPKAAWTVRTATPEKSMRLTWNPDGTSVEVQFVRKSPSKTQVVINHNRLPDKKTADERKAFWGAAADRLRDYLLGDA